MLGQLLELIKNNQGVISRDELCETLDVSPEMLEGMLSSLIRMGYLVEITDSKPPTCPTCEGCNIQQQCTLINLFQERRYEVVDKEHESKA